MILAPLFVMLFPAFFNYVLGERRKKGQPRPEGPYFMKWPAALFNHSCILLGVYFGKYLILEG